MRRRCLPTAKLVRGRMNRTLCIMAALYLVLGARFFYIQVVRASFFRDKAEDFRLRTIVLPARRGTIYDCKGKELAVSVELYDIQTWPRKIKDKDAAADKLSGILGWPREKILDRINTSKRFVFLVRRASTDVGKKVKSAKIYGVEAVPIMSRVYPGGELASHIIGFTDIDGIGREGIEKVFDKYLSGTDGHIVAEVDARGKIIPGTRRERVEPVDGMDIMLTVDSTIQHSLEAELRKSYEKYSAAGASAVVIDPRTGDILALANLPTYNPNKVAESDANSRRNRAVTDLYEPGSTLKAITACAALDQGAIDHDDTFGCSGSMRVGRRTVRCSLHPPFMGGHGSVNVGKMLMHSCNMAAAGIGFRVGKEKLWEYEKKFGLYDRPGTGMLGEMTGWSGDWRKWEDVRLANIAFGQGIVVTPMQLANAYAVIANDGVMMHPHIVREIRGRDGLPHREYKPKVVRRVISADVARDVAEMLHGVCEGGTGKPAVVDGYQTSGKTGSAQKAVNGSYNNGKFVASFIGFLPTSNPRAVILVAVDEPEGIHWGATCAAPVFREVGRLSMWHLKVRPDESPDSMPVAGWGSKSNSTGEARTHGRGGGGRTGLGG